MGIAGLLPALKSVMDQVHIAKYAGKTVGIDASGWLYKGAYSCPMDVVLHNEDADGYGCCSVCVHGLMKWRCMDGSMQRFCMHDHRLTACVQVFELLHAADQVDGGAQGDADLCV